MVWRMQQLHQTLGIFVRLMYLSSRPVLQLSVTGTTDSIGLITSGPTHISLVIACGRKKRSSPSVGILEMAR